VEKVKKGLGEHRLSPKITGATGRIRTANNLIPNDNKKEKGFFPALFNR
jgi:hypothetical protein